MFTPLWALLGSAIWLKLRRRRWWSVQEPAEHWCRWKLVGHRRSTICHTVRISCKYCRCPFWSFCATEPELKLPARQHLEDSQGFSSPQMISSTFKLQESPYFRQGAFRVLRTRNYFISSDPHHGISRHITFWHLYMPLRSGPVPTEIWRSRSRFGSAQWHLALAVKVRQCPLRSGARCWGPAVPTETLTGQVAKKHPGIPRMENHCQPGWCIWAGARGETSKSDRGACDLQNHQDWDWINRWFNHQD